MIPTMPESMPSVDTAAAPSFEEQAVLVASRLRTELAALFAALPERVEGGTDLNRQLGLGSTLSWHLHSFATATNPIAGLVQLPGRASMDRLVRAARKRGLPEDLLQRLMQAFDQFEACARDHGGDRRSFDSMLATLAPSGREKADLKERRATFRSNSHLWGVQARVSVACLVVYPGDRPGTIDGAQIVGAVVVHIMRPGVPLIVGAHHSVSKDDSNPAGSGVVVPAVFQNELPALIEEFCSRPVPTLSYHRASDGRVQVQIEPKGWGKSGALTYFRRLIARNTNEGRPETGFALRSFASVPTEVQLVDLLIPRGWVDSASVVASSLGCRHDPASLTDVRPDHMLPVPASPAYLGRGVEVLQTPDVDRYPEIVSHVLREAGWRGDDLDVFRLRVPYPILHTRTILRVGRPQPIAS